MKNSQLKCLDELQLKVASAFAMSFASLARRPRLSASQSHPRNSYPYTLFFL